MTRDEASIDEAAIKEACHAALWDARPRSADATDRLVADLEGHVRLLAPKVAARVPTMDESMASLGPIVLRHADQALDPATHTADRKTRLHQLGTAARALLAVIEKTDAPEPDDEPEATDPTGWLLVIGPQ